MGGGRRGLLLRHGLGAGFAYSGFGAEFAYRQSFGGSTFRTLAAMIKFAVPGT
jgi:hypothetical protein